MRNRNKLTIVMVGIAGILLAIFLGTSALEEKPASQSVTSTPQVSTTAVEYENMTVHFLDVSEGACVLLQTENACVLIDGGPPARSSYVVSYLQRLGIQKIDLVVVSHYDADHLSGIVGVLTVFDVEMVCGPDYEEESKTYQSFLRVCEKKGITLTHPKRGSIYQYDELRLEALTPGSFQPTEDNDYSLVFRAKYGDRTMLFPGDATETTEEWLLEQKASLSSDVYFVSHHGSNYASTDAFLTALQASCAVISVGVDNAYGHPGSGCLERLVEHGLQIRRTDLQGTIVLTTDGSALHWSCTAVKDGNQADYPKPTDSITEVELMEGVTYVLNGNTMRYHVPDCSSIPEELPSNWYYFYGTKEEAEALGYIRCGKE